MNVSIKNSQNAGFSLIELMVVVAIIGILAAIAVPNYTKFQVKARESEAKTTLGAIYMSEKAYIQETLGATDNLVRAGYTPDGAIRFKCGFGADPGADVQGPNDPAMVALAATYANTAEAYCNDMVNAPTCSIAPAVGATTAQAAAAPGGVINMAAFNAQCVGDVGGTAQAVWDINEANMLTNPVPSF